MCSRHPNRAKGRSIVTSNPPGQAMAQEQTTKLPLRWPDRLGAQQHNRQTIPAVQIPHRQRLDTGAIAGAIPPLKINCPHVMAALGNAYCPAPDLRPGKASALAATQAPTLE